MDVNYYLELVFNTRDGHQNSSQSQRKIKNRSDPHIVGGLTVKGTSEGSLRLYPNNHLHPKLHLLDSGVFSQNQGRCYLKWKIVCGILLVVGVLLYLKIRALTRKNEQSSRADHLQSEATTFTE